MSTRSTSYRQSSHRHSHRSSTSARAKAVAAATAALAAGGLLTACFPEDEPDQAASAPVSPSESSSPDAAAAVSPSSSEQRNPDLCKTENLDLSVSDRNSGAGSKFFTLDFTNKGSNTCELKGFPGVSLVADSNGTQLGRSAKREENVEYDVVSLDPGSSAVAKVRLGSTGPQDPAQCQPTPADGFRVYPPEETTAAYIPVEGLEGCRGEAQILSVQPVLPSE